MAYGLDDIFMNTIDARTREMSRETAQRPRVGITMNIKGEDYVCRPGYAAAIVAAGGFPVMLAPDPAVAETCLDQLHGILFTGGLDPDTRSFDQPLDPRARLVHPSRQAFETALLDAIGRRPHFPVLGVCLGMQMMALHAGGRLEQFLPDVLPTAADHQDDRKHTIVLNDGAWVAPGETDGGTVVSSHRQAVADPGRLRCIGKSEDGVIEAITDGRRRFYVGVQWHPERASETDSVPLNQRLIEAFVAACRQGG